MKVTRDQIIIDHFIKVLNSVFSVFRRDFTDFRENVASITLLCAGSRHATIAKQAISENSDFW